MTRPVQYAQGYARFFDIDLVVDPRVLIPRLETEFLVKKTIEWLSLNSSSKPQHVLDVGTGSGAIAISLAKNRNNIRITASDISPDALSLAKENSRRQNLSNRINFILGDLLEPIDRDIDVILANLPYIPTSVIPQLDPSVRDFEPHLALDGGRDGLDLYRRLLDQIKERALKPKLCIFEINDHGGSGMALEISKRFPSVDFQMVKDSSDLDRYAIINF